MKDLEDDYDVYVSDEYAFHIHDGKLQQDHLAAVDNMRVPPHVSGRHVSQFKPSKKGSFVKLRKITRQSTEIHNASYAKLLSQAFDEEQRNTAHVDFDEHVLDYYEKDD